MRGTAGVHGGRNSAPSDNESINGSTNRRFTNRPSVGLLIWGPMVPASDNKFGMLILLSIQTILGSFCFSRFRKWRKDLTASHKMETTWRSARNELVTLTKIPSINEIPSLNRFSDTSGSPMFRRKFQRNFALFRSAFFVLTGIFLLSQSTVEVCRLLLVQSDPWVDQAKMVRNKKIFNDIAEYFGEPIDARKIAVKSVETGNSVSLKSAEIRQTVAILRAQQEQKGWIIKWFGPIEYKPLSLLQYLNKIEYTLNMESLLDQKSRLHALFSNSNFSGKLKDVQRCELNSKRHSLLEVTESDRTHYQETLQKNLNFKYKIADDKTSLPVAREQNFYLSSKMSDFKKSNKKIFIDPIIKDKNDIQLKGLFDFHDPWLNLALETALSIKFIPTLMKHPKDFTNNSGILNDDDSMNEIEKLENKKK